MYKRSENLSNFDDVGEFHQKFGLRSVSHDPYGPDELLRDYPKFEELMTFRVKFLMEELMEFIEGMDASYDPVTGELTFHTEHRDHAQMFDSLLDLVYVAMGTAHLLGYPWQLGWRRVQDANMAKVRAQKDGSDSKRGSSFDVVKPEGWTAPDIAGLLEALNYQVKDTK